MRQFRGEVQRWTREAEQLRRMLQGEKIDPKEIDEMLRNLRQLNDDRVYKDVEELARLQAQVTDSAKRVEYDLRRKVEGADAQLLLSGSDEVPEKFRKSVEQYYRSLSKAPEARQGRRGRQAAGQEEQSRQAAIDTKCPCAASSPSASVPSWGHLLAPVCRRRTTFSSNGDSSRRR